MRPCPTIIAAQAIMTKNQILKRPQGNLVAYRSNQTAYTKGMANQEKTHATKCAIDRASSSSISCPVLRFYPADRGFFSGSNRSHGREAAPNRCRAAVRGGSSR